MASGGQWPGMGWAPWRGVTPPPPPSNASLPSPHEKAIFFRGRGGGGGGCWTATHEHGRGQWPCLQRLALGAQNALPALDEPLFAPHEGADLDNLHGHILLEDLGRLAQGHAPAQQLDEVPGVDDGVRVPRLLRGLHSDGPLRQVELPVAPVLLEHQQDAGPNALQVRLHVLGEDRREGRLLHDAPPQLLLAVLWDLPHLLAVHHRPIEELALLFLHLCVVCHLDSLPNGKSHFRNTRPPPHHQQFSVQNRTRTIGVLLSAKIVGEEGGVSAQRGHSAGTAPIRKLAYDKHRNLRPAQAERVFAAGGTLWHAAREVLCRYAPTVGWGLRAGVPTVGHGLRTGVRTAGRGVCAGDPTVGWRLQTTHHWGSLRQQGKNSRC